MPFECLQSPWHDYIIHELKTRNNIEWPVIVTTRISKSPYPRMATAVLNSTESQPRNHYLSTINQLLPPKSKLNFICSERKRIEDRCSSHISVTQHLNTFDDILRVNGYPENSIEKTKRPQNAQRKPRPAETEWSYLKIPYISERLNHRITNIFRKKTSRYALHTNPKRSGKPYPTPPRSANALETNALSLAPDCVYDEMQCTSSRLTAAISNTLVARHASSTTA